MPIFFIVSGMRLEIRAALTPAGLLAVLGVLAVLVVARALPAVLRRDLDRRGVLASGLMLATNVSFVVVAADLGVEVGLLPSSVACPWSCGLVRPRSSRRSRSPARAGVDRRRLTSGGPSPGLSLRAPGAAIVSR